MAWGAQYVYNNTAAVPQTWNRVSIGADGVKYVNDTARALGIDQFFEFKRSNWSKQNGTTKVPGARWNVKFSSRVIATELEPFTLSYTVSITDTLASAVTTARTLLKDIRLIMNALQDADSEIDDTTATRLL